MITGMLFAAAVVSTGAYAASTNTTATTSADQQAFLEQTSTLRSTLAADHAELRALMHANTPDTSRIRTLSEKISKERDTLRQKALEYKIAPMGHGWAMGSQYCDYSSSMMGYGGHRAMHDSMMHGEGGYNHMQGYGGHHMQGTGSNQHMNGGSNHHM